MLTTITSLIARPGREAAVVQDFEDAFARAGADSHHLSTLLLQQLGGLNFLISQFADQGKLEEWRQSVAYRDMIRRFESDSLREICTLGEPIVRVTVPSEGSGPKWKIFASTWIIVYPLLLLFSSLLNALAPSLPLAARLAITSSALSIASIWLITPTTQALTRVWRLRNQQMQVDVAHSR
jgi:antibiotic biosynthesis monooxygenase (ABM) superfamily enzyme